MGASPELLGSGEDKTQCQNTAMVTGFRPRGGTQPGVVIIAAGLLQVVLPISTMFKIAVSLKIQARNMAGSGDRERESQQVGSGSNHHHGSGGQGGSGSG